MSQRDIKFRVWDKGTKSMVFNGFHVIGEVTAFGGIECHINENPYGASSSIDRWNDFVLMQWTGLLDKNGREIYEGDVMMPLYEQEPVAVTWDQGTCSFDLVRDGYGEHLFDTTVQGEL